MNGVNKVLLIGNLGSDPEARATQSGSWVAKFSVATTTRRKDADGEAQEQTEWHRVVVFGRLAEVSRDYLRKGRQVFVEGRLHTNEWEDAQGQKKRRTEIYGDNVQFLGGGKNGANGSDSASAGLPGGAPGDDIPF